MQIPMSLSSIFLNPPPPSPSFLHFHSLNRRNPSSLSKSAPKPTSPSNSSNPTSSPSTSPSSAAGSAAPSPSTPSPSSSPSSPQSPPLAPPSTPPPPRHAPRRRLRAARAPLGGRARRRLRSPAPLLRRRVRWRRGVPNHRRSLRPRRYPQNGGLVSLHFTDREYNAVSSRLLNSCSPCNMAQL
ncbi:hypothetical protein GLYMA_13G154433v4 [Glycine max]|nr:hypothetical protein GLYMA_13G154433v4 [Glycine max]